MSNFTGVTFAKQRVTPSDDAIIRRAILSDGKLTGCEISYSGSTLTMAPGQLLVCGRQIRHPSVQNWAVVDATSGFARLVLTVDLTRAATKETFEQVETSVEYASAEDGFVELEQSDINSSGIRYQVALCVVSLGVGGITGVVSQLEKCEAGGSGGLNFNVVGGLTQPANLKGYAIWVLTDVPISGWIFAATEPESLVEGMVWFPTGTSSPVAFNALKKNAIEVYPTFAKQYIGGALVDKKAKSYQDGEWVDWIPEGSLYWYGDERTEITGGWTTRKWKRDSGAGSSGTISITRNSDNIEAIWSKTSGENCGVLEIINDIDLTNVKTITAKYDLSLNPGHNGYLIAVTRSSSYWGKAPALIAITSGMEQNTSLDVESLNGLYDIAFALHTDNQPDISLKVYEVQRGY